MTQAELESLVAAGEIDTVIVGFADMQGRLTGKRVAVIGTGSSAVQSIPIIAQQASALTVFEGEVSVADTLGTGLPMESITVSSNRPERRT